MNKDITEIVSRFSKLDEIIGITLAGSQATGTNDAESDYDLYVYATKEIAVHVRESLLKDLFEYIEIDNRFWETEDDGNLKNGNVPVEIIYRDIEWVERTIKGRIENFYADTGYTTCIWDNFINSIILYDKTGKIEEMQKRLNVEYPENLMLSIIKKNFPLLKKQVPAYYHQIAKAVGRGDIVSINHRVAAFLASYFDIVFAVNKMTHPGEKKILKILKDKAKKIPENMEQNVADILALSGRADVEIMVKLDELIINLEKMLLNMGIVI